MGKYAITEKDEAARRKAEIRAAERDVRKSGREASRELREIKNIQKWIEQTIDRLAREAHRDYRKGGSGEARCDFSPPTALVGWKKQMRKRAKALGVDVQIEQYEYNPRRPVTMFVIVSIKPPS